MTSGAEFVTRVVADVKWGVAWGAMFGAGFAALAALGLALGAGRDLDVSYPRLTLAYFGGSIAVGIIAGLGRPMLAWGRIGPYVIGAIAGIPIWYALSFGFGMPSSLGGGRVLLFLFVCLVGGGVGALVLRSTTR